MSTTKFRRGMRVQIKNGGTEVWTLLEKHPDRGTWWLHRRNDAGEWQTTHALYTKLNQVFK